MSRCFSFGTGKTTKGKSLWVQWASIEVAEIYQGADGEYPWNHRVWGGTLGTWDTRAQGLGGWSYNVHHFFDVNDRILYLGSGGQRSGHELGVVQELGEEILIASENGIAVYYFDKDNGRHLKTVNALTGSEIYGFGYDGNDNLTQISSVSGNTGVAAGAISTPFGIATTATPGAGDYWTQISNPVSSMGFAYTGQSGDVFHVLTDAVAPPGAPLGGGLLESVTDPNSGGWSYTYDGFGALLSQGDAGNGSITVSREGSTLVPDPAKTVEDAFAIQLTTAGGKNFKHEVVEYEDGSADRKITTPDGTTELATDSDLSESGTLTASSGSGSGDFTRQRLPGAKLSLQSPLPARLGSLDSTYSVGGGAYRIDQLHTTVGFTQTTKWNGATTTTTAEGSTITTTTPGGRKISTMTDGAGRPTSIALPGLPAISISYDAEGPKSISQGGRTVELAYDKGFVNSITDPLDRVVSMPRDAGGRVQSQDVFGLQSFGFDYDANGNVTSVDSPQSGGYSESIGYTATDQVDGFTLPAGPTTVQYSSDREATGGSAPQGGLDFDGEGRLTAVGSISYKYDDDDYVEIITSPDGKITYEYDGNPVPTSIVWDGPVSGSVSIGRNTRFQATSVGAGSHTAPLNPDGDGVQMQAGQMNLTRDAATFLDTTQLGSVTDDYDRNEFGEPTFYEAMGPSGTLFSEEYERDKGGRIKSKTVRIADGAGGIDTYTAAYGYYDTGQLRSVKYNDQGASHYVFDSSTNLVGVVDEQSARRRLYVRSDGAGAVPGAFEGSWGSTSLSGALYSVVQMDAARGGALAPTTVDLADCGVVGEQRQLAMVVVGPPLGEQQSISVGDTFDVMVGAGQGAPDDDLRLIGSAWFMDGGGNVSCQVAVDRDLNGLSSGARGVGGVIEVLSDTTGLTQPCAGGAAQAGDRLVVELGFSCQATSTSPVQATIYSGGSGAELEAGEQPGAGAGGHPGYVDLPAAWDFQPTVRLYARTNAPPVGPQSLQGDWGSGSVPQVVAMARERAGQATAATVTVPDCSLATDNRRVSTVLVSPPLAAPKTLGAQDRVDLVMGASRGGEDEHLHLFGSAWIMDGGGAVRCQIALDRRLSGVDLPITPKGVGGFVELATDDGQLTTPCDGATAQAGDRLVVELGMECAASAQGPVQGAVYYGGNGNDLLSGVDPQQATCDRPGFVELSGDWSFQASTPSPPCDPNPGDVVQTVLSLRRNSISGGGAAANVTYPNGTIVDYSYTYGSGGGLGALSQRSATDVTDPLNPIGPLVTNFVYDGFGNLTHVDLPDGRTIDYLIDATNRRVGRILKDSGGTVLDHKGYLYQSTLRPVVELDANDNVTAFFVYIDKPNVPEYMTKGGVNYRIITDHLGSVRLVVKSSDGTVVQRMDYDEWGAVTRDTNPGFQPFGFAGGLYDPETGLVRFGARDYDAVLGRWMARDPIGFGGGEGNLYSYVGGEPVNSIDSNGLISSEAQWWANRSINGTWIERQGVAQVLGTIAHLVRPDAIGIGADYTVVGPVGGLGAQTGAQNLWLINSKESAGPLAGGHPFYYVGPTEATGSGGFIFGSLAWSTVENPGRSEWAGWACEGNLGIFGFQLGLFGSVDGHTRGVSFGYAPGPYNASIGCVFADD